MVSSIKNVFASIKFRILLLVFAAIGFAFLISYIHLLHDRTLKLNETESQLHEITGLIAQQEADIFDGTRQLLEAVANLPIESTFSASELARYFATLVSTFHRYKNFYLFDMYGNIIASALGSTDAAARNADIQWIDMAKTPEMGGLQFDNRDHEPVIYFKYPRIDHEGKITGVLVAVIDLSYVNTFEKVIRDKLRPEASLTKLDSDGTILVQEPNSEASIGKQYPIQAVREQLKTNQHGIIISTGANGQQCIFSFERIQSKFYASDIFVVVSIPERIAFASITQRFYLELIILGAAMILLSLLVLFSLQLFLMRDVQELLHATRNMQSGNMSVRAKHYVHSSNEIKQLVHAFNDMADSVEKSHQQLLNSYDATLEGWISMLDMRDNETSGHSIRVAEMTMQFAQNAGVPAREMPNIRRGALLHDIGKMGIPDAILQKQGPLTEEEWKIMKTHPDIAYTMLSKIDFLQPALDIPYCHHEKWDGTGYPRGLKNETIPFAARLFAIIDVWDALNSERPYRKAWPRERAIDYIRENAGTHFDPQLVALFMQMLEKGLF